MSKYILIKQGYLLRQLNRVNVDIEQRTCGFWSLCRRFNSVNRKLSYQCEEIVGYNRFWSAILTVEFGVNIADFVYLLYAFVFHPTSLEQLVYIIFFMVQTGVLIFAVIYRCSRVDRNNDLCYAANVSACFGFQRCYGGNIPPRLLLNVSIQIQT